MADEEFEQEEVVESVSSDTTDQPAQEGFREHLGQNEAAHPLDDADSEELADAPIDSDLDYDTEGAEADDTQYPSM